MSYSITSETVDIKIEHDTEISYARHVTVLEVGGVTTAVVTYFMNKCVKSFYNANEKKCHSRLQLNYNPPWGMSQFGEGKVMVAVSDAYQIATLEVTPELVYLSHINTEKKYASLTVISPSRLAAGGWDYVDILNMQGEMIKSVTTHNNMELFKDSDFMCVSNAGHLLVSDLGTHTVTCMTGEGEIVWIYSGKRTRQLSYPRGITRRESGKFLVVDGIMDKVIEISECGEYVRDVLTEDHGIRRAEDICEHKYGTLYLGGQDKIVKFALKSK